MKTKACDVCGNDFLAKRKEAKCCSIECGHKRAAVFLTLKKKSRRPSFACGFCGSVSIATESQITTLSKKGRAYCDHDCASKAKSIAYKGIQKVSPIERKRIDKEKRKKMEEDRKLRFKCCLWCGSAHNNPKWCSRKCWESYEHTVLRPRKIGIVRCEYCEKECHADKHAGKKFCSLRCTKKAHRQKRKYWARTNGPYEFISLSKLIIKSFGLCKECGVNVTRYNGRSRITDGSIDHIVPISKGGPHTWSNIQLLCMKCNSIKSDSTTEQGNRRANQARGA